MANTRMAIVMRRDLMMTAGLIAAQTLHAGMMFIQYSLAKAEKEGAFHIPDDGEKEGGPCLLVTETQCEWIKQPYVSVLAVDTPEELLVVKKMAEDENLPVHVWKDVIPSKVLQGQVLECIVGISIGPSDSDQLRKATGLLPLY